MNFYQTLRKLFSFANFGLAEIFALILVLLILGVVSSLGADSSMTDYRASLVDSFAPDNSAQPFTALPPETTAALGQLAQTPSEEIEPERPPSEIAINRTQGVIPLLEASPFFISAGLAQLQSVLFYQAGVGFKVADQISIFAGGGFGLPKSIEVNERPLRLAGFYVGGLALYHVTENLRVGVGGGLLNLYGKYDASLGGPQPELFKVSAPYLSAVVGFQFQFILITLGVNYVF